MIIGRCAYEIFYIQKGSALAADYHYRCCALYTYTYNKAVAEATADITKAAKDAAELVTFTDPDKYDIESTDEQIITSVLTNACNQYEVDIIYFLLPNLRDNTVMYLTRGTSALQGSKEDSHPVNDLTGHYVEGGLTDEMKRAFEGDESGIVVHITNLVLRRFRKWKSRRKNQINCERRDIPSKCNK